MSGSLQRGRSSPRMRRSCSSLCFYQLFGLTIMIMFMTQATQAARYRHLQIRVDGSDSKQDNSVIDSGHRDAVIVSSVQSKVTLKLSSRAAPLILQELRGVPPSGPSTPHNSEVLGDSN
ncbi:hypothetical protein KP509_16G008800 [Ceratopteris richardii]|uniref:Uncharacterized protein n=1 Tax=Ceratopteris richardii TaxID=49495 RepID=A0A8T2SWI9_CERRI|nr:hypothetical protein KP509_16G008800 [Ceratopteris richardii]